MQKDFIKNENECDCDEDNNCGCSYPNNINKTACGCENYDDDCPCMQSNAVKPTEIICICDSNAECSCNKIN